MGAIKTFQEVLSAIGFPKTAKNVFSVWQGTQLEAAKAAAEASAAAAGGKDDKKKGKDDKKDDKKDKKDDKKDKKDKKEKDDKKDKKDDKKDDKKKDDKKKAKDKISLNTEGKAKASNCIKKMILGERGWASWVKETNIEKIPVSTPWEFQLGHVVYKCMNLEYQTKKKKINP